MSDSPYFEIIRDERRFKLGTVSFRGRSYEMYSSNPTSMLVDTNLSWAAKGILAYLTFISGTFDNPESKEPTVPDDIILDLIQSGYLVEVQK